MEVDIWWVRVGEVNWQGGGGRYAGEEGNVYAKLCVSKHDIFIKHSIVQFV